MLHSYEVSLPSELYDKHATIYFDTSNPPRAAVLYFHGGGLLYGSRNDLPAYHIEQLCSNAYAIIALDYPLAPASKIDVIERDVLASIDWYLSNREGLFENPLPYFLWGRSAGAYLCLLTLKDDLPVSPAGILSYYGYGLLCDTWYDSPNPFYTKYPAVSSDCLKLLSSEPQSENALATHFAIYVHLRQTGKWASMFSCENPKELLKKFSLRSFTPAENTCPIFFAHNTNDPDVPFLEFLELTRKFDKCASFVVSDTAHDFDRNTDSIFAKNVIRDSISFLDDVLKNY